jgi:hypothetical protein
MMSFFSQKPTVVNTDHACEACGDIHTGVQWLCPNATYGEPYSVGVIHGLGVMQRLYPHWYILSAGGRHVMDGNTFLFGAIRNGRFTFAFQFVAESDLLADDSVRVEFPEFGCARTFLLGADVQEGDLFVVQNYLDLKPALVKIGNGGVEALG